MKKYVAGLVGVIVLFFGSLIYRQQNTMLYQHFPIPEDLKKKASNAAPFYLFLFFTKKDCISCLVDIVEILKHLPSQFCTGGVAPGEDLKDEPGLRQLTRMPFPLYCCQDFKSYLPCHTPTLFGVSPTGKIIFVLPGIPGQQSNLKDILLSTYGKLYPSFEREFSFVAGRNKKAGGNRP